MIIFLSWLAFATLCGAVEAILFHRDNKLTAKFFYRFGFDIHVLFTVIRGIVALLLIFNTPYPPLSLLSFLLTFPFMHDGMYYTTRNMLDEKIYKKRWFDQSYTTNATISIGAFWRVIFFALGLGLFPMFL